ncbi:MAG: insulinase family protein [Acidobacteriota bacterium]|nr:insulinase family protein [Acidobacteriota bacterium]
MMGRGTAAVLALALLGSILAGPGCRRDDPKALGFELLPSDEGPFVAIRLLVEVGSAFDPPGKEGLCRLAWSVLAGGGSRVRSAAEIAAALAPLGTEIRLDVGKEASAFSATVRREDLDALYAVLRETLLDPGFREGDFERLKAEQIDGLRESLAGGRDERLAGDILGGMIHAGQPYGRAEAGTLVSAGSITLDEVRDFYREHFVRGNLTFGLAGSYPAGFPDRIRKDFLALPASFTPRLVPQAPGRPRGIEAVLAERPAETSAVILGVPISATPDDDDFFALWIAAAHLGEPGLASARMVQAMRDDRGLGRGGTAAAESFCPGLEGLSSPGLPLRFQYFTVRFHPVNDAAAPFLVRWAVRELGLMAEEGLTEERFVLIREHLIHSLGLRGRSLGDRLARRMEARALGRADLLDEAARILPRLSVGDIRAAVRKYLSPNALFLAAVTKDAVAFRDALTAATAPPERPGNAGLDTSAEDEAVRAYPLLLRPDGVRIISAEEWIRAIDGRIAIQVQ